MSRLDSAFSTVVTALSNPLIAAGVLVGTVVLGAAGLLAARRWGWRPVPSVLAGISLGVVLGVTMSRTRPDWMHVYAVEGPFCHLTGFSMVGGSELMNVLLFMPLAFFAVLATRRPLPVAVAAVGLSVLIELVQSWTERGVCETRDLLNNSVGAVVAVGVAALLRSLTDDRVSPGRTR